APFVFRSVGNRENMRAMQREPHAGNLLMEVNGNFGQTSCAGGGCSVDGGFASRRGRGVTKHLAAGDRGGKRAHGRLCDVEAAWPGEIFEVEGQLLGEKRSR